MLLAIDVGNTNIIAGVWSEGRWQTMWRLATDYERTEDELAVQFKSLCDLADIPFHADGVVIASVVPALNDALTRLSQKWFHVHPLFVRDGGSFGLEVRYDPPSAVGADRVANAIAAKNLVNPPIIIVDFGTATTFDSVAADGAYVGGAILPGVLVAMEALHGRTAKLPQVQLVPPDRAIGTTTVKSLQSGIMIGYAGAIDAIARRISEELGGARIIATGGLGEIFADLCDTIESYEPFLTLDGLRLAWQYSSGR